MPEFTKLFSQSHGEEHVLGGAETTLGSKDQRRRGARRLTSATDLFF